MKKMMLVLLVLLLVWPGIVLAEGGGVHVILPEGYDGSGLSYPVVYLLPEDGFSGDESGIAPLLQAEMAEGGCMDMIIVCPSFAQGDDPAAKIKEIAAQIDGEYRTIADAQHRVLLGTADGGYLAWALGLNNRETFGLMASIRGNFAEEGVAWKDQLGDVYSKAETMCAAAFDTVYTYMTRRWRTNGPIWKVRPTILARC